MSDRPKISEILRSEFHDAETVLTVNDLYNAVAKSGYQLTPETKHSIRGVIRGLKNRGLIIRLKPATYKLNTET